jgi:hypothetical protein
LIISDHHQPFYLRTPSKVYSSSNQGYLIIGGLSTGDFAFTVGFPKNKWTAMKYKIQIEKEDLYLLLKKIDSTTWGLYNKKGMQVYLSEEGFTTQKVENNPADDVFSKTLAEVSDNPNLLKHSNTDSSNNSISKGKELTSGDTGKTEGDKGQVTFSKERETTENTTNEKERQSDSSASKIKDYDEGIKIKRTVYESDSTGLSMHYELQEKDITDQVVIFIPIEKVEQTPSAAPVQVKKKKRKNKENKSSNSDFTEREGAIINTETVNDRTCLEISSLQDFKTLRRQMTLVDDEEKMIVIADSIMKESRKCYPVEQIKNLALLFLQARVRLIFVETGMKYLALGEDLTVLETLFLDEEQLTALKKLIEQKR